MNNQIEKNKYEIIDFVKEFFIDKGVEQPDVQLNKTARLEFGDVSLNVSLIYAKKVNKKPFELAEELRDYILSKNISNIADVQAVQPGYVNIYFDRKFYEDFITDIITRSKDEPFGSNLLEENVQWVVEHTSPNPNKAMHLGHLRNNLVGMGIINVLKWCGANVKSDAVFNDRGIAIAKVMWGFLAHQRKDENTPIDVEYWVNNKEAWYRPNEVDMLPDTFVTKCYIAGEADCKKDEEIEKKVRDFVVKWENNDEAIWKLWDHVLKMAYEGIDRTLNRLGSYWDKVWYEHEHYQKGKDYVNQGFKDGAFKKLDDGAILTDLADYNLSDTILLKNDGTSLYITQDIALTALKKESYKADKLVWVIGPEQSLAMQQLFAVCEQLKIGEKDSFVHVPYGYVGLKTDSGFEKMSSRKGTTLLIDDLIDDVKGKIYKRLCEDGKSESEETGKLAESLAIAAVKFGILKFDRPRDIAFDPEQSIDTRGDSGMYVMYSYVRTQSIIRKASKVSDKEININEFNLDSPERNLLRIMLYFPNVVETALTSLSVHHVTQYLLDLTSEFNSWYAKEQILDGSENEAYKVALVKAVGRIIRDGLSILGIESVEQI